MISDRFPALFDFIAFLDVGLDTENLRMIVFTLSRRVLATKL